jgi:hypothetical protein
MRGEVICTTCGYVGKVKKLTKGSIWIEMALWLFFLIPGLLYSFWRLTSKQDVCSQCNNPTIIPVSTPKGQELLNKSKSK